MRTWMMAGALLLACGSAAATDVDCDVHSDYDFALTQKSLILTRKSGTPKTVLMRQGRLFVDDRWVAVDAADRERLAEYEKKARETMPLAAQIGRDAATIAFTALGEVAKGFSRDPERTEARLREARVQLDRSLARSISPTRFNSADLGKGIGDAVGEAVPLLVGDIVGGVLRAALRGDTGRLEELDQLDSRIDAIVEPRAKALERNAETLCRSMRALDAIDGALDYRHDGKPLGLLRVEAGHRSGSAD